MDQSNIGKAARPLPNWMQVASTALKLTEKIKAIYESPRAIRAKAKPLSEINRTYDIARCAGGAGIQLLGDGRSTFLINRRRSIRMAFISSMSYMQQNDRGCMTSRWKITTVLQPKMWALILCAITVLAAIIAVWYQTDPSYLPMNRLIDSIRYRQRRFGEAY